jgi:hypothetical protein
LKFAVCLNRFPGYVVPEPIENYPVVVPCYFYYTFVKKESRVRLLQNIYLISVFAAVLGVAFKSVPNEGLKPVVVAYLGP